MPHIVIFLHEFFSALQHLKHCCHIIGTQHSVSASNHCNSHVHGYGKKAYILKYQLDFKNNLINNGCSTLYHLSMTCITVYNLSINGNYRILAAELNYRFTGELAASGLAGKYTVWILVVKLVYLFMPHFVVFIHELKVEFISALERSQHLKHYCHSRL